MPHIEHSVQIQAPLERVYRVARQVERFPEFMDDLQTLTVLERSPEGDRTVTEWVGVIREFKMTLKWTQEDRWSDADYSDHFTLLKGDMDRMEGCWKFTAEEEGWTRFDSVVDYEYSVPLIGPLVKSLIKKKFTANIQATMEAIKRQAELNAV